MKAVAPAPATFTDLCLLDVSQGCGSEMPQISTLFHGTRHPAARLAAKAGDSARDGGAGQSHWPHPHPHPVQCPDDPHLESAA